MGKEVFSSSEINNGETEINNGKTEISQQLSGLENRIIEDYKFSLEGFNKLQDFIKQNSVNEISKLKEDLLSIGLNESDTKIIENLSNNNFQLLSQELQELKNESMSLIQELGEELGGKPNENFISSKKVPGINNARYFRACNPTKPHHHIDSCIVGIYQATYSTIKLGSGLIIDLCKLLTFDGYKLLSGKAKLPDYEI